MQTSTSTILAVGGLFLAAKMWMDVCDLIRQSIKMNSYSKMTSCALDIMKIVQEESKNRNRKDRTLHG